MPHSYFAVLGLEPCFALPAERLEQAYRAIAKLVHPDRHVAAPPEEQRRSLATAADVNEAYHTLRRPAPRARHLLSLRGCESGGSDVTPAFLMQQIEWREALEFALSTRDAGALRDLQVAVQQCAAQLCAQLETQLDRLPDNSSATRSVHELMFIEKLKVQIDEASVLLEE
jgi:molecular chaperone HscB